MVDLVTPEERRINRMILEAGGIKGKAETPVSRKTLTERRAQGRSTGKANKKLNVEERNRRIVEQRLAGVPAAHLAAKYLVSTATVRRIVWQARKEGTLPAMLAGVELGQDVRVTLPVTPFKKWDAQDGRGERPGPGETQRIAVRIGRRYLANAMKRLVELAELDNIDEEGNLRPISPDTDRRVVMIAVRDYLDRMLGREKIKDPDILKPTRQRFDPSLYSPEQLAQIEATLRMVAAAQAEAENDR